MLDMITKDLHAEDDAPPRENKKSDRAFRLEDFVYRMSNLNQMPMRKDYFDSG